MNREILVGRTDYGYQVWITMAIHPLTEHTTSVEHEPVVSGQRLTISGAVRHRKGVEPISVGQVIDDARRIVRYDPAWSPEDVERLLDIWERWHLNDMRAGCAHMTLPEDKSYDARKDIFCEQGTGYKYGAAWLYEPLPDDVVADVQRFQQRLKP